MTGGVGVVVVRHGGLLPVSVDSPEVKSSLNPLRFHSRVFCCPILISICLCGMIVWVHDACVVAMNVDLEHWNIYAALLVLFIWSMMNMSTVC